MGTCRRIYAHKYTAKCPLCNYTSKIPYIIHKPSDVINSLDNSNSVHSKMCPVHRLELVKVGGAGRV